MTRSSLPFIFVLPLGSPRSLIRWCEKLFSKFAVIQKDEPLVVGKTSANVKIARLTALAVESSED